MTKPFVSVLIPAYNAEKYISEALQSVLDQTYEEFEIVIIDDNSTDTTWEVIQSFADQDSRIKPYQNEENLKVVQTRNKAFRLASDKAKYYAIMDADDIMLPTRLQRQITFLETNDDYGIVGGDLVLIDEESKAIKERQYPHTDSEIRQEMGWRNMIPQPATTLRAKVIDELGGYEVGPYDRAQDYELWCRIGTKYKLGNLRGAVLKYRMFKGQGKYTHLKETIKSTLRVQGKYRSEYMNPKSLFLHIAHYPLLLLPKRFVYWLFRKLS